MRVLSLLCLRPCVCKIMRFQHYEFVLSTKPDDVREYVYPSAVQIAACIGSTSVAQCNSNNVVAC